MKKNLLLCVAFSTVTAYAQDVIVKRDGATIISKVLEVGQNDIKYKKFSNQQGPTYTIDKSEVSLINYEGGDRDTFDEAANTASQHAKQQSGAITAEFTAEDQAANEAALEKSMRYPASNLKVSKKRAAMLYCILRPDRDSRIADANVELSFHGANTLLTWKNEINFVLSVKNKTNQTIYLDLGNTFFVRGDEAEAYFVPTASSSTSGTSGGVGVNLGAVAGAMGVGGSVGKLASGVNVSKGASQYNTTITYSQRVISIPPMSTKSLPGMAIKHANPKAAGDMSNLVPNQLNVGTPVCVGAAVDFEEGQLPVKFGSFLTYSFTEDIQTPRVLRANLSIRRIIGLREHKDLGMSTGNVNGKDLSPEQLNDAICIIKQAK